MGRLLWETIQRTTSGPLMAEDKFETEFFPTVLADLQAKYKLEFDPDEPAMIDPDMADAVFQAGKELLLEVGLYCKNTRRIVKYTEDEINEVIATARQSVTLGYDRQEITLGQKHPGDGQRLYTFFPAGALTTDVELYRSYALTVMQEPTCDGVIPIPLYAVGDLKNIADSPAQTLVCLTEARIISDAATWAGKPGLFLGIPMSATTPLTLMSAFGSGLYNKRNCTLPVQIIQDMRIDYDRLNLAFYAEQHGIEPWMSCSPALYAYLTGPEQGAMEIIAHTLGMLAYAGGALTQAMSVSVHGTYLGNDINSCNTAAGLAADRNLGLPWLTFGSMGNPAGALSDTAWYATASACISASISGIEGLWLAGGSTGYEARWAGEMGRAVAGLSPKEGVELLKKISAAEKNADPPPVSFSKLYDPKTLRPAQELVDHYRKFTKIFQDLGLEYPTWIN
jgi:methylamine--corrinoid protein Co-methyltransferase